MQKSIFLFDEGWMGGIGKEETVRVQGASEKLKGQQGNKTGGEIGLPPIPHASHTSKCRGRVTQGMGKGWTRSVQGRPRLSEVMTYTNTRGRSEGEMSTQGKPC
jgi:hypothetical protein